MTDFRPWPLLVLLPLLLGACVASNMKSSESKLRDTLRYFETTVRWGQLDRMSAFLVPQLAGQPPQPGLDNIRVTHYDTVSGPTPVSDERWVQTVAIEYVLKDSQVVKRLTDNQVWELDAEAGGWLRANPLPRF